MAARWIRLGYLEPLDKKNIPNSRTSAPACVNLDWDKDRKYSLPWQSGMTGIGYNTKEVGEIKSFQDLFDPKFKGRVSMFTDARDALGNVMLHARQEARRTRRSTTSWPRSRRSTSRTARARSAASPATTTRRT